MQKKIEKMSISLKKNPKPTNIKHNNRDFTEKDWNQEKNQHINRNLSSKNIVIVQKDIRELYDEQFTEVLVEYNAGKRKDRQIKDYYEHIKKSGKHRESYEFVAAFGSKEDWDNLSFDEKKKAGEVLAAYAKDFSKRHPNLIVYNAVVHLDEAGAPHLHLNFVPVATGYKKGLKKQVSFSKALENEHYPGRGKDSREQWNVFRRHEVTILSKFLKEMGYERKLVGTNNIEDMNEFKKMVSEATQEIGRITEQKQEELKQLNNDISNKKDDIEKLTEQIAELEASDAVVMHNQIESLTKENHTLKQKNNMLQGMVDLLKKGFEIVKDFLKRTPFQKKKGNEVTKIDGWQEVRRILSKQMDDKERTELLEIVSPENLDKGFTQIFQDLLDEGVEMEEAVNRAMELASRNNQIHATKKEAATKNFDFER